MQRRASWNLCTCVVLAAVSTPAGAQDRDPATDPALNDPNVSERVRDLERPAGAALSPTPRRPAAEPRPQRAAQQDPIQAALRAGPLRPEGTFISRQRGSLVRGRSGEWILVPRRDANGRAERPMVILPSRNLERMVAQAGPDPEAGTFLVTGQVFAYRGVNYLLLPVVPPVLEDSGPSPTPAEPAAEEHPAPGTPPPAGDPDLGEVIRELESHRGRTRELGSGPQPRSAAVGDHADTPAEPGAEAPDPALLPEGTMLLRRRGRLVRNAGGETALLLDTDADTATALDPPLVISPCAMLERMEWLVLAQGEAMVFEVTGRVLEYRGRNHLLPMLFRAYPPTELERRQ